VLSLHLHLPRATAKGFALLIVQLTSVFGEDKQNWMRPILAFSTLVTLVFAAFWVRTSPSTSSQSSIVPLETKPIHDSSALGSWFHRHKTHPGTNCFLPQLLNNFNISEVHTTRCRWVNHLHHRIHTHWRK